MLQRYGRLGKAIVDLDKVGPARLTQLLAAVEQDDLRCAVCHYPLDLRADAEQRWRLIHKSADAPAHEPETEEHWRARQMLLRRLRALFPSATIAEGGVVGERAVDCLLVTPKGGRLAVEVECAPLSGVDWRARRDGLAAHGVVALWVLGADQLPYKSYKRRATVSMKLSDLHVAMLADGCPLWMLDHEQGYLVRLLPHPEALELIRRGVERISCQVECALRRYPLSQLRMEAGTAKVLTLFDPPLPEFRPLQKTLALKLRDLRLDEAEAGAKRIN